MSRGRRRACAGNPPAQGKRTSAGWPMCSDHMPLFCRIRMRGYDSTYFEGVKYVSALGAIALLSIAIAAPVEDAAAQDPVGGAILGGVTGGVIGGALGGGR